jgi:hypothetical protein
VAGTAARFDANTDRVSYTGSAGNPPDTFTLTLWVYLTVDLNDYTSLYRRYTSGGAGRGQLGTDNDGTTLVWWPSGVSLGVSMVVGEWRRVAVVCSGATVTTYAATPAGPTVVASGSSGTVAAANQVTLSGVSVGNGSEWINGRMAYVRTWSAALSQAEIEAEWASTAPVRTSGLWANWPLSTNLLDVSGNDRHLAAGSTPVTFTEDGPPLTASEARSGAVTLTATAGLTRSTAKTAAGAARLAAAAAVTRTGAKTVGGDAAVAAAAGVGVAGTRAATGTAPAGAAASVIVVGARTSLGAVGLPSGAALTVSGTSARAGIVRLAVSAVVHAASAADARDITLSAELAPQGRITSALGARRWTAHLEAQP